MTEFSNLYKDGIDHLVVPDFSMEELGSFKQHKKYTRRKKLEGFITTMIFLFLFSIVASATAYAAYTIHKKLQFTPYGIKIDFSDTKSSSDGIVHEYTNAYTTASYANADPVPTDRQQDFIDEITTQEYAEINYFDNWTDALKVIDFPIVYPENVQYSELEIAYQTDTSFQSVEASYITDEKELITSYIYFRSKNWDYAIDYNARIANKYRYTNKYNYEFWITECQYEDGDKTNVAAYINNYVIQLSFSGYRTNEIYEILEELNLHPLWF